MKKMPKKQILLLQRLANRLSFGKVRRKFRIQLLMLISADTVDRNGFYKSVFPRGKGSVNIRPVCFKLGAAVGSNAYADRVPAEVLTQKGQRRPFSVPLYLNAVINSCQHVGFRTLSVPCNDRRKTCGCDVLY